MAMTGDPSPRTTALPGAARDFLPAALEILETPANPAGRALALVIAAMLSIAIGWAVLGKVDVVAVAPGRTVAVGGNKLVQPLEIGTVRAIHVADGETVAAGQVLVELDPTEDEVDFGQLSRQRAEQALETARQRAFIGSLLGEEAGFDATATGAPELLVRIHRTQLESDLAAFAAERASLEAERSRRLSAQGSAVSELAKSAEILPILREREAASRDLYDKGLTTRPQWQQVQASLIEAEHDLEIRRNRLAEAGTGLVAIDRELAYQRADRLRLAYAALTEAETALAQIELALQRAEARRARRVLRAPVAGTVQQLAVHTVGGVVQPGSPLMVIVPADARMEIRARVLNRDMGRIREGMPVEVKLEAFNFTRYGTVPGTLVSLSQDAIETEAAGLVYEARIALERPDILAEGAAVRIPPGMAVTAEIRTGQRRIADFLLSPLKRYRQEAIREP
ncbi:HlyD family type I secretion periplasmic adaptor subunit [Mangrovicoccus algicola]|nr:HlyD family type I secretion periplasmic adaptor subunit [Mangrovicoccus algicola]